eukprot:gene9369-biopygen2500
MGRTKRRPDTLAEPFAISKRPVMVLGPGQRKARQRKGASLKAEERKREWANGRNGWRVETGGTKMDVVSPKVSGPQALPARPAAQPLPPAPQLRRRPARLRGPVLRRRVVARDDSDVTVLLVPHAHVGEADRVGGDRVQRLPQLDRALAARRRRPRP